MFHAVDRTEGELVGADEVSGELGELRTSWSSFCASVVLPGRFVFATMGKVAQWATYTCFRWVSPSVSPPSADELDTINREVFLSLKANNDIVKWRTHHFATSVAAPVSRSHDDDKEVVGKGTSNKVNFLSYP